MAKSNNKKKFPVVFFLIALAAIGVVMFVANSKSLLKRELSPPADGVKKLYTVGDSLVAISPTKEIHIRDWNRIDNKPKTIYSKTNEVIWLPGDKLLGVSLKNTGVIVISNPEDGKEHERFTLDYNWRCEHLCVSRNGRFIGLALVERTEINKDSGPYKRIGVATISTDTNKLSRITTIEGGRDDLLLRDFAISDDGAFVVIVGQKNDLAWIAMIDTGQKQLSWQQTPEISSEFIDAVFSPDGEVVYTGGVGRSVYGFQSATGTVLNEWQMEDYKIPANKRRIVSCIAVSHDGRFLAAGTEPAGEVYVWNTKDGNRLAKISDSRTALTALAFAPDSSSFVTAGIMAEKKIKIWKIPHLSTH